jgi:hypothetical protein
LGEVGFDRKDINEFLFDCLDDYHFRIRFFAADALTRRKDPSAIPHLEDMSHRMVDGHLKAAGFRAIRRIRDSLSKPAELAQLKESLEKLVEENQKLKTRVEGLEGKVK